MKRCLSMLLTVLLVCSIACPAAFAAAEVKQESRSISVLSISGDSVSVNKGGKKSFPAVEKMALRAGYTITTGKASFVYFQIDDDKAIKLDQNSSAIISQATAKKLCITLKSGKLFFDVKKPLAADSTLSFRAGNASMGIRGTSGTIGLTPEETSAMLFSGKADFTAGGQSAHLTPGVQAVLHSDTSLTTSSVALGSLGSFELESVLENTDSIDLSGMGVTPGEIERLKDAIPALKDAEQKAAEQEQEAAAAQEQKDAQDISQDQAGGGSSGSSSSSGGNHDKGDNKPDNGKDEDPDNKPDDDRDEDPDNKPDGGKDEDPDNKPDGGEDEDPDNKPDDGRDEDPDNKPDDGKDEDPDKPDGTISILCLTNNLSSGDYACGSVPFLLEGHDPFTFSVAVKDPDTAQTDPENPEETVLSSADIEESGEDGVIVELSRGLCATAYPVTDHSVRLVLDMTSGFTDPAAVTIRAGGSRFTVLMKSFSDGVYFSSGDLEDRTYDGRATSEKLRAVLRTEDRYDTRYRLSFTANHKIVELDKNTKNPLTEAELEKLFKAGVLCYEEQTEEGFTLTFQSLSYSGTIALALSSEEGERSYSLNLKAPPSNAQKGFSLTNKTGFITNDDGTFLFTSGIGEDGGLTASLSISGNQNWSGYALLLEESDIPWDASDVNFLSILHAVISGSFPEPQVKRIQSISSKNAQDFRFEGLSPDSTYVLYLAGISQGGKIATLQCRFSLLPCPVTFGDVLPDGDSEKYIFEHGELANVRIQSSLIKHCEISVKPKGGSNISGKWSPSDGPADALLDDLKDIGIDVYEVNSGDPDISELSFQASALCSQEGQTISLKFTDIAGNVYKYTLQLMPHQI